MSKHPPITLRYFDARGRAQFLRYYLRARNVPFQDERVPVTADFAAWQALRGDRTKTGPFHKLPVLVWGDRLVVETLLISSFLHEAFGDGAALPDDDNLRHGMLTSSLYSDVMTPIGTLVWGDVMYPGVDMGALSKRTLERVGQHLQAIEQSLRDWRWFARLNQRPVMLADCLLWEELDVTKQVFGPHSPLAQRPSLSRFYDEFGARAICEALLREHPCPITARPQEAEAIAKIQSVLS